MYIITLNKYLIKNVISITLFSGNIDLLLYERPEKYVPKNKKEL